ncbi:FapA family protein [Bacillus xiapuensis]|uniref:FapA family protein n=1 Tax=Bacillus xiapuensis TaxID=2014075 RepID=UPI0018E217F7|nr:FapA family protein [Bacillus xiapuensis]
MEKTVKTEGATVEEAVQIALRQLGVSKNQTDVEIIQPPSSGLLGIKRKKAVVRVSIREDQKQLKENAVQQPAEETKEAGKRALAQIKNGQFSYLTSGAGELTIVPHPKLEVYINDQKIEEETVISDTDKVGIQPVIEKKPAVSKITLAEDKMKAVWSFEPGEKVAYQPCDHRPDALLRLKVKEEKFYFNEWTPELIHADLAKLGVKFGIDEQLVQQAAELLTASELVLAKGKEPEEGQDGRVHFHVDYKIGLIPPQVDLLGNANFRETRSIPEVHAGQCIATVLPPEPGVDGMDVTGNIAAAKPVQEASVRLGKGVYREKENIYASETGRLHAEIRGRTVKIEVLSRLVHEGDVDLSSGNLRFQGDIEVQGSIQEKMKVEAEGDIDVKGQVSGAFLFANKSAVFEKNLFATVVHSGTAHLTANTLATEFTSLMEKLKAFSDSLDLLLPRLQAKTNGLQPEAINQAVQLLLQNKFSGLLTEIKAFVRKASHNQHALQKEWTDLANNLYRCFIMKSAENDVHKKMQQVIKEAAQLYEYYATPADDQVFISVPYAINSQITCSGDIMITGQGVYNSRLKAGGKIEIAGYIKGGEAEAGKEVNVNVAGSETGARTLIKVAEHGQILLHTVYPDTTIQVGRRKQTFYKKQGPVAASLDEEGMLQVRPMPSKQK